MCKKSAKGKEDEEVAIGIGIMEFNNTESRLKPIRGKRLMLRISNKAPYADICSKAEAKFKAYYPNHFEEGEQYHLIFESAQDAQFIPGTTEFFTLKRFKEEIGKDYKNIVLYLCTNRDLVGNEGDYDSEKEVDFFPKGKKPKLQVVGQVESDEILARQLQSEMDNNSQSEATESNPDTGMVRSNITIEEDCKQYTNHFSVVSALKKRVQNSGQFFIVARRGAPLTRCLTLWARE